MCDIITNIIKLHYRKDWANSLLLHRLPSIHFQFIYNPPPPVSCTVFYLYICVLGIFFLFCFFCKTFKHILIFDLLKPTMLREKGDSILHVGSFCSISSSNLLDHQFVDEILTLTLGETCNLSEDIEECLQKTHSLIQIERGFLVLRSLSESQK